MVTTSNSTIGWFQQGGAMMTCTGFVATFEGAIEAASQSTMMTDKTCKVDATRAIGCSKIGNDTRNKGPVGFCIPDL